MVFIFDLSTIQTKLIQMIRKQCVGEFDARTDRYKLHYNSHKITIKNSTNKICSPQTERSTNNILENLMFTQVQTFYFHGSYH